MEGVRIGAAMSNDAAGARRARLGATVRRCACISVANEQQARVRARQPNRAAASRGHTNTLPGRLELPTLRLTASRSNQLSYGSHVGWATTHRDFARCVYKRALVRKVRRRPRLAALATDGAATRRGRLPDAVLLRPNLLRDWIRRRGP